MAHVVAGLGDAPAGVAQRVDPGPDGQFGDDVEGAKVFEKFLDSPRRVILEVEPTQRIGYDGQKMGKATAEWMKAQKGSAS